jgi:hypothetical protein
MGSSRQMDAVDACIVFRERLEQGRQLQQGDCCPIPRYLFAFAYVDSLLLRWSEMVTL